VSFANQSLHNISLLNNNRATDIRHELAFARSPVWQTDFRHPYALKPLTGSSHGGHGLSKTRRPVEICRLPPSYICILAVLFSGRGTSSPVVHLAGYCPSNSGLLSANHREVLTAKEKAGVSDLFQSRHLRIAPRDVRFTPGNTIPRCAWFPPGRFELCTVRVVPNRFKVYIAQQ
jgi:hypothetical protein